MVYWARQFVLLQSSNYSASPDDAPDPIAQRLISTQAVRDSKDRNVAMGTPHIIAEDHSSTERLIAGLVGGQLPYPRSIHACIHAHPAGHVDTRRERR